MMMQQLQRGGVQLSDYKVETSRRAMERVLQIFNEKHLHRCINKGPLDAEATAIHHPSLLLVLPKFAPYMEQKITKLHKRTDVLPRLQLASPNELEHHRRNRFKPSTHCQPQHKNCKAKSLPYKVCSSRSKRSTSHTHSLKAAISWRILYCRMKESSTSHAALLMQSLNDATLSSFSKNSIKTGISRRKLLEIISPESSAQWPKHTSHTANY